MNTNQHESPLQLIVFGAGPIGLETALYARYLGYAVKLLERGDSVAANVRQWGHVRLFTPFGMNSTPLGVAAIRAQNPDWQCPAADATLTGAEFYRQYLLPLSQTDLLADSLCLETEVLAMGRKGWLKGDGVGDERRGEAPLELLTKLSDKSELRQVADVVIDCSGTYGNHNWLGAAGTPAIGELASQPHIEYGLPDVLGTERQRYADRHTLVVGAGYSAATVVAQLAELAANYPQTRIIWLTRTDVENSSDGPIRRISNDRLAYRDELAVRANALAADSTSPVDHLAGQNIGAIAYDESIDQFSITLKSQKGVRNLLCEAPSGPFRQKVPDTFLTPDRVVANVGYRPDNRIYTELQVHECYATGGPMKLAAQLMAQSTGSDASADCLDQSSCGPKSLLTPEPNFYILGAKSYGRRSQFLLSLGFEQIRDLFTILGEREDLDLYATMPQRTSSCDEGMQ